MVTYVENANDDQAVASANCQAQCPASSYLEMNRAFFNNHQFQFVVYHVAEKVKTKWRLFGQNMRSKNQCFAPNRSTHFNFSRIKYLTSVGDLF